MFERPPTHRDRSDDERKCQSEDVNLWREQEMPAKAKRGDDNDRGKAMKRAQTREPDPELIEP